jgi:RNA polymerase sigma-70 factor (ECF subfamily)
MPKANDPMTTTPPAPVAPLIDHFFRHEAGRLVAVLTRYFGWRNFDLVEEMVQATLLQALQAWQTRGVPDNPSGWIHRVARNKVIDALRRVEIRHRVLQEWAATHSAYDVGIADWFDGTEIEDSQLRLIFACCHPLLNRQDQLALTLKTLCGFGIPEIARALLVTEDTVKKRLQRAKQSLVDHQVALEPPDAGELVQRLHVVHQVLYLIFNEGYSASQGVQAIREDLCEEAARLCYLLCEHRHCSTPTTRALMALMLFHAARLEARLDHAGRVLLMEDQDRTKWDSRLIRRAKQFLDQSAEGTQVSLYHLEAGIALYHCSAPSYTETDWPAILRLYDALLELHRSPIYLLNRAIVIAQIEGPQAAIRALHDAGSDDALRHYHLFDATLGELHRRAGDLEQARRLFQSAKEKTKSESDREIIDRRLEKCSPSMQPS